MKSVASNPREFSFEGNLAYSDGAAQKASVETILLENLPGAMSVNRAARADDRNGIDYWVVCSNGKRLSIDLKARRDDWLLKGKDDLALEIWSVFEIFKEGWTRDASKQCDFVLWHWEETGRWCLMSFPMLCAVMQENWFAWWFMYPSARQRTTDRVRPYHSECVFVPRRDIWAAIYRKFGGAS